MHPIALESDIKRRCKNDLESWGWTVIHLIQTNMNGIPDTLAVRCGKIVFIEFKRIGKNPEPLQEYRIKKLREQGIEVLVARDRADLSHLK